MTAPLRAGTHTCLHLLTATLKAEGKANHRRFAIALENLPLHTVDPLLEDALKQLCLSISVLAPVLAIP